MQNTMSTKPELKPIPKIPASLDEFIVDLINELSNPTKAGIETEVEAEISKDPDGWKKEEAYFIFSYLVGSSIRNEIKKFRDQGKSDTEISNELFRNNPLLKPYIFILSSDSFKHYNKGYYNEKIHDLAELAIRANKFISLAYKVVKALPEVVDFTKLPEGYYVAINKFILIGYDSKRKSLKYDIDINQWKHFAEVKGNRIGVGIQSRNNLIYYREIPVADNQESLDSHSDDNKEAEKNSGLKASGGKSVADADGERIATELELMAYLLKISKQTYIVKKAGL